METPTPAFDPARELIKLYHAQTPGGNKLKKAIEKLDFAFARQEDLIKNLLVDETARREEFKDKKNKYVGFMLSMAGAFVSLSFFPAVTIPVGLSVIAAALAMRGTILLRTRRTRTERANIQSAQSVFCRVKVARDLNLQARDKLSQLYRQIELFEAYDKKGDEKADALYQSIERGGTYFYHLYQALSQAQKNVLVQHQTKPPKALKVFDDGTFKMRRTHEGIDAIHQEIRKKDARLYRQGLKTIALDVTTIASFAAAALVPPYALALGAIGGVSALADALQTRQLMQTKRQIKGLELRAKTSYKTDLGRIRESILNQLPASARSERSIANTGNHPQKRMSQKLSALTTIPKRMSQKLPASTNTPKGMIQNLPAAHYRALNAQGGRGS